MTSGTLQSLLLDFDGPICNVFAGFPAEQVARELYGYLQSRAPFNWMKDSSDPHEILRASAELGKDISASAHRKLVELEMEAVKSATPTPYVADVIRSAQESGVSLAVVSNNAESAVVEYLSAKGLMSYFNYVSARTSEDVALMKPNPYLVTQAIDAIHAARTVTALVGDQTSDIVAAHSAGVQAIGYANKSGKREEFVAAGADLVISSMAELL